jgi:hypothetical protein
MTADWLKDGAKAGVYHLSADARELAGAAAASGLMVAVTYQVGRTFRTRRTGGCLNGRSCRSRRRVLP